MLAIPSTWCSHEKRVMALAGPLAGLGAMAPIAGSRRYPEQDAWHTPTT